MERFAYSAALTNTVNELWCAFKERPEMRCLDIGAASTLGNSLNRSAFDLSAVSVFGNGHLINDLYSTADDSSLQLFGQYDLCDGKVVGDGLINVFDIATLLAYIFRDYAYASLPTSPNQVETVHGRDLLEDQCDTTVNRSEYLAAYSENTCIYFDHSPPAAPAASGRRRLSDAMNMFSSWTQTRDTPPPPKTLREWTPLARDAVSVPDAGHLSTSTHLLSVDTVVPGEGVWYTLRLASLPLRLHVVLSGIPTEESTRLSYEHFDGSPPSDPSTREVRYTRLCEFSNCDRSCASIETAHPYRRAMVHNTLELVQRPIVSACPYETHVWIPGDANECVTIEYMMVADGVRGSFGVQTACARELSAPSPPASPPSPWLSLPPPYEYPPPTPSPPSVLPSPSRPPNSTTVELTGIVISSVVAITLFVVAVAVVALYRRKQTIVRIASIEKNTRPTQPTQGQGRFAEISRPTQRPTQPTQRPTQRQGRVAEIPRTISRSRV